LTPAPQRVWRITQQRFAKSSLSGFGGLLASGRWHERGVPIVYASETPELAVLEALVHVPAELAPPSWVLVAIDIDRRVRVDTVSMRSLPKDWQAFPAPDALRAIGMRWIQQARSAVLRVPSAVVPVSHNMLINPRHPDSKHLRVAAREPFPVDSRLRNR